MVICKTFDKNVHTNTLMVESKNNTVSKIPHPHPYKSSLTCGSSIFLSKNITLKLFFLKTERKFSVTNTPGFLFSFF